MKPQHYSFNETGPMKARKAKLVTDSGLPAN